MCVGWHCCVCRIGSIVLNSKRVRRIFKGKKLGDKIPREFDIPKGILDLIYTQALLWCGTSTSEVGHCFQSPLVPLLQARVLLLPSHPIHHNRQPLLAVLRQEGEWGERRHTPHHSLAFHLINPFFSSPQTVLPHHQPARLPGGWVSCSTDQFHLPPLVAGRSSGLTHSSWLCCGTVSTHPLSPTHCAPPTELLPLPQTEAQCQLRSIQRRP